MADEVGASRRTFVKRAGIAVGIAAWSTPIVHTITAAPAGAQVVGGSPPPEEDLPPEGPPL